MIVIDPLRTETAALADEHHFIRPGTDALLLAAMLQTILEERLTAEGEWRDGCDGFEDLGPAVRRFTPERVAGVTGLDAETIRRLARDLAITPRAVLYGRLGTTTQRFGGLCSWLLIVLNTVTGHLDRPGGLMFGRSAVDLVDLGARAGQRGHFDAWRSHVSGLPEFGGELPVSTLAEEIDTDHALYDELTGTAVLSGVPVEVSAP